MTTLLIVTAFIFFSYYAFLIRLKLNCPHQKIILAGLLGYNQIILTQLFLGVSKLLYLPALIFLNIGITLIILLYSRIFKKNTSFVLRQECQQIIRGIRNTITAENCFLLILLGFVLIWMAVAVYFLPPRNGDDLSYHLPPIYQYIIDHKIFLLSVDFNKRFAFPENAELLFMWPVIFLHSQQFVNSVQCVVALWGAFVVYGLARILDIPSKISLFISLIFLFTPVVLSQMGTCYIDIITSVFFLTILYSAGMFYKTNRLLYFYSTALAAGLLWGMKYNVLLYILLVMPFLCMKGAKRPKHWVGFITVFLIAGGFWYLRNLWILKTPIYPLPFSQESLGIYSDHEEYVTFAGFLMLVPSKLLLLYQDSGLGSLHGGYGIIFWGLALPAWFYVWMRAIIQKNKFDFWMYLPLLMGIGQLMWVSLIDIPVVGRYSLFVVAIGLMALGKVMALFDRIIFFRKTIKILCVVFTVLAVVHLSKNRPNYLIDNPVRDFVSGEYTTEQSYGSYTGKFMDDMTINAPKGLSCYVTTDYWRQFFFFANLYGTKLQNRIWNFQQDKTHPPDAFLYFINRKHVPTQYCSTIITPDEMMADPNYLLIGKKHKTIFFIRKDFFQTFQKKQLLANYYKTINRAVPAPK